MELQSGTGTQSPLDQVLSIFRNMSPIEKAMIFEDLRASLLGQLTEERNEHEANVKSRMEAIQRISDGSPKSI